MTTWIKWNALLYFYDQNLASFVFLYYYYFFNIRNFIVRLGLFIRSLRICGWHDSITDTWPSPSAAPQSLESAERTFRPRSFRPNIPTSIVKAIPSAEILAKARLIIGNKKIQINEYGQIWIGNCCGLVLFWNDFFEFYFL